MILNLPFKEWFFYHEKPVEIVLRIGTLEDLCEELKIEFWQISDYLKKDDLGFSSLLLYHGYLTACEKKFKKPKYNRTHAIIWYNYISAEEKKKFIDLMTALFGKISAAYKGDTDKKKVAD
jgi:hypothetical protein